MSQEPQVVRCQQCDDSVSIIAADTTELRRKLDEVEWAAYGTGVTPFAEELSGTRNEFSCPRCANELTEARLNRLGRDVINELRVTYPWYVVRTAESATDYL